MYHIVTAMFSNAKQRSAEFANSTSVVAQFAFLILVLIVFVILARLVADLVTWIFSPSPNPVVLSGTIDGTTEKIIPTKPGVEGAVPILRSDNDPQGLEFTWSVWIFVSPATFGGVSPEPGCEGEDGGTPPAPVHRVFNKGNTAILTKAPPGDSAVPLGLAYPNNCPGVYIDSKTNDMKVYVNTFGAVYEEITIESIPVEKWFNVVVQCIQRNLDVFVNGRLVKRHTLSGLPVQNYAPVNVGGASGIIGKISDLRYFSTPLGLADISAIVRRGPDLTLNRDDESLASAEGSNYLANRWYFHNPRVGTIDSHDEYN